MAVSIGNKLGIDLSVQDGDGDAHAKRLVDIHGERLAKMDKFGVAYNILRYVGRFVEKLS